jgi:15-cis-phytoene synthase
MTYRMYDSYNLCQSLFKKHYKNYYLLALSLPFNQFKHICSIGGFVITTHKNNEKIDLINFSYNFFIIWDLLDLSKLYEKDWVKYHPIMKCVFNTIDELNLSRELFERFFNSMKMDLNKYNYKTFTELEQYMDGSASVIGEIILYIIKESYNKTHIRQLLPYSNDLSIAIQFTNIIKNINNADNYIPTYFLDCYNIDLIKYNTKIEDRKFKDFMDCQLNLNREIYNNAQYGINELEPKHREIIQTAKNLNLSILNKIENNDYNIFDSNNLTFYEQLIIIYKTLSYTTIIKILFNYVLYSVFKYI